MAGRGLMLVALAACGAAEAQPEATSGIRPPAGWQAMPAIASAARIAATGPRVDVAGAEAWGEPARGCYALWIALRGEAGDAEVLAKQTLDGLAAAEVATADVKTTPGGLELAIRRAPYRGRLRVTLGAEGLAALACVANEREPVACQDACAPLLAGWSGS